MKIFSHSQVFLTLKFSLIALVLHGSFVSADSSVWKVSNSAGHIYLGGTLHVLSAQDYPLPAEFSEAYAASDLVVFETDIEKLADPKVQQKLLASTTYTDDATVRDDLQATTIAQLEKHLSLRGIPLDSLAHYKPSMLSILITMIELQAIGITSQGVDNYFSSRATTDNKIQLALESPEEQMSMIAAIGEDNPDQLIQHTIRDAADLRSIMTDLVSAWRDGDLDKLDSGLIQQMRTDYPTMYKNLLVIRNNNWLPTILQLFNTADIEFVMVGAAHLVGKDGLLQLLKAKGYTVTPM